MRRTIKKTVPDISTVSVVIASPGVQLVYPIYSTVQNTSQPEPIVSYTAPQSGNIPTTTSYQLLPSYSIVPSSLGVSTSSNYVAPQTGNILPVDFFISPGKPYFVPITSTVGSGGSNLPQASISSLTVSSINGLPPEQLDVAAWASFPASQNVDMSNFSIVNAPNISATGDMIIDGNSISFLNGGDTAMVINQLGNIQVQNELTATILGANAVQSGLVTANNILAPRATISTVNSLIINASTIQASSIITETLFAMSTVHSISSISTNVIEVSEIDGLTTINGQPYKPGNTEAWAVYPAISTVSMEGNSIIGASNIYSFEGAIGTFTPSSFSRMYTQSTLTGENTALFEQQTVNSTTTTTTLFETYTDGLNLSLVSGIEPIAVMGATSTLGGWVFQDQGSNSYTMTQGILTAPILSTSVLNVSTINGVELTGGGGGGINVSLVNASTISSGSAALREISSESISSLQAALGSILTSSISFKFDPTINIDTGITSLVAAGSAFVGGCLGAFAGVAGGVGSGIYELGTGIAGAVAPRFDKYITNNAFETINQATQLQVSTLGEQISTIYRFTENVLSTNIYGSTATMSVEVFVSTLSPLPPFNAIRSLSDPLNLPSSPFEVFQYAGQWVPIPGGGIDSNVSTLSLSTLSLAPSTILKGDLDGAILEVLEAANETDYAEVKAAGYWVTLSNTDPNFGIIARNSSNVPVWIDSNYVSNPFALQGKQVSFSEVDFPVKDGNNSTITNLFVNNSSEPSISYGLYPEGFPSTIAAQIKFQSSIGGYGGVQILSQLGESKSLTVNGSGVLATNILAGSNSQYPLLVQVPDLDEWSIFGFSTISGGIGKCDILNTTTANTGQLTLSAPDTATGLSKRIVIVDSSGSAVGINNTNPQESLDVVGNIAATGNLGVDAFNVSTVVNFNLPDYLNRDLLQTTVGGVTNTVLQVGVNVSPADRTLEFTVPGAAEPEIIIRNTGSNVGIGKVPDDGVKLDVSGNINAAGNITASNNMFTNTANFLTENVSTLNVSSNIRFNETNFAAPRAFLTGGQSNAYVINTNTITSPYTDTITFYKGFTNQDAVGGYLAMAADNGLFGINKIPQTNIDLDVNGTICASNISTPQISTSQAFISSLQANNTSTNTFEAGSAAISSIRQPIMTEAIPHSTCALSAVHNWDYFVNSWGAYHGRQPVNGGYFINLSNSLGSGIGVGTFIFPPGGVSSLQICTGTYFTNSTSPGLTHPIWVGNGVPDANGQLSTINVYGDDNMDAFVSYLAYV